MEILMSGELYIKRRPDIRETSIEDLDRLESMKEDPTIPEQAIEAYQQMLDMDGEPDYTGCNSFWVSVIHDDGIKMAEQSPYKSVYPKVKTYESKEEMDENFISLREFLSEAEYVGRNFKPKEETARNQLNTQKLLYKLGDLWIVEENDYLAGHNMVVFAENRGTKSDNYEFYGEVDETYKDPSMMYQTIFKEIYDKNKKKKL